MELNRNDVRQKWKTRKSRKGFLLFQICSVVVDQDLK